MSSYPKWLYHPTKEARIVADEAAHQALGPEWVESPALLPPPEEPEEKPEPKPAKKGK